MKNFTNFLNEEKIKDNIASFEKDHHPLSRGASFDYCFNYFQEFTDKKKIASKDNIQKSCLHLAFYLASWGMLRNSFLLQKSMKYFEPLMEYFSTDDCDVWNIDVDKYDEENIIKLTECYGKIKDILLKGEDKRHEMGTLVTKIMLGVFGNVPAFDAYFRNGFGFGTFNKKSLVHISEFYKNGNYPRLISDEANRIKTFDYDSGKSTDRSYTRAKIVDAIFFIEGFNKQ